MKRQSSSLGDMLLAIVFIPEIAKDLPPFLFILFLKQIKFEKQKNDLLNLQTVITR